MLKNIIKQVWNQRRQNGWILLELIIAGFFLWTVIDPVYILTVNHLTPSGYDMEGRYVLRMGMYGSEHGNRDTTVTKDQIKTAFLHTLRLVRDCPEVESVCLAQSYSFPDGGSWNGSQYTPDTLKANEGKFVQTQEYTFNDEGGNPFKTYGMKNALTGGDLEMPEDAAARKLLFVSESFARHMFGILDVVGRKVYSYNKEEKEIGGVFGEYKHSNFKPAYPLVVSIKNGIKVSAWINYQYTIVLKLKDGVDEEAFIERFEKEVTPQMATANLYYKELNSFEEQRNKYAKNNG
ncbi:MAG: ABC transporter permease, partial [Bacteroides sp.]|nr:ABC transporter permease [Bacteroides sp.]